MLSLAHLREYEAKHAKQSVIVNERELGSPPTSSIPSSANGSIVRHQSSPKPMDLGSSTQQTQDGLLVATNSVAKAVTPTECSDAHETLSLQQKSSEFTDLATSVSPKAVVTQISTSGVGPRVNKARSRLCRSSGVEPNDTFATTALSGLLDMAMRIRLSFAKSLQALANIIDEDGAVLFGCMTCWGCCEILPRLSYSQMPIVSKKIAVLDQACKVMQQLTAKCNSGLYTNVQMTTDVFLTVLDMCCEAAMTAKSGTQEYPSTIERGLHRIFEISAQITCQQWEYAIKDFMTSSVKPASKKRHATIYAIRSWLISKERTSNPTLLFTFDSNVGDDVACPHWLSSLIERFYESGDHILQISGPVGCGKGRLVGKAARYVQAHQNKSTKVLSFSIDPMTHAHQAPLTVVRMLLLQLLDTSIGDLSLFNALENVFERRGDMEPPESEATLWLLLKRQLALQAVPVLVIIDGLNHIDGDCAVIDRIRGRLCDIGQQKSDLQSIVLTRPSQVGLPAGVFEHRMDVSTIVEEVRHYLRNAIVQSVKIAQYPKHEREVILRRVLERNVGSFLEANMLIRVLELANSYSNVLQMMGKIASSLTGPIDYCITHLDYSQSDTFGLLSWLLCNDTAFTTTEIAAVIDSKMQDFLGQATSLSLRRAPLIAAIVEIKMDKVHFVHPLVGQRLRELSAENKIPLTIREAYERVALQALRYIKSRLPQDTEPIFRRLSLSAYSEMYDKLHNDRLFSHCVASYLDNYERSSPGRIGENRASYLAKMEGELPDSPMLVFAEYAQLQVSRNNASIEQKLLRALELRKFLFGNRSHSVVQTLAALAHLQMRETSYVRSLNTLVEAWNIARDLYGDGNRVSNECAEKYREALLEGSKRAKMRASLDAEKVFWYLWETRRLEVGDMDARVLEYGQDLTSICLSLQRWAQAETVSRNLYEATLCTFGALDERTVSFGEALMKALEHLPGRQDEALLICEELANSPNASLELWDTRRTVILFRLVQQYTERQLWSKAETKLYDYLAQLYDCRNRVSTSVPLSKAIIGAALHLSKTLCKRSAKNAAVDVLMKSWSYFEQDLRISSEAESRVSMLPLFRALAEELVILEATDEATSILTYLQAWHNDMPWDTDDESMLIALLLTKFYQLKNDSGGAQSLLESLYARLMEDDGLRPKALGIAGLSVCVHLASFYSTAGQMLDAIKICTRVLQSSWPSLLDGTTKEKDASVQKPRPLIQTALLLTSLLERSSRAAEADAMIVGLQQAMLAQITECGKPDIQEAECFADLSERIGSEEQAIGFWKTLRNSCRRSGAWGGEILARVNLRLALLYRTSVAGECEGELIAIIQELDHDDSYESSVSRNEAVASLCEYYEKQQRYNELRKWYLSLWSSYLNQRSGAGVSGKQGLELFRKYVAVLVRSQDHSGAIRLARELRTVFLAEFGPSDIYSINAAIELAILLEMSSTTREESVSMYETVCTVPIDDDCSDVDERAEAIRRARGRLASLVSSQSDLAHRAEYILTQSWEEAVRRLGSSPIEMLTSLKALTDFYRKQASRKHAGIAMKKIESTVRTILNHERDLFKLYSSAENIGAMYLQMNGNGSAMELIVQLRAEFAERESPTASTNSLMTDRRCLVFVTTLEATLRLQGAPMSFTDVISGVLIETSLYESWKYATKGTVSLETKLSVGGELLAFLTKQGRSQETSKIRDEIWTCFKTELSPSSGKTGPIWDLFEACVLGMTSDRSPVTLLESAFQIVYDLCDAADHHQALELAKWIERYIRQGGGFKRQGLSGLSIRLSLHIAQLLSSNVDEKTFKALQGLSARFLSEAWRDADEDCMGDLPMSQISIIIKAFAAQRNHNMLERILQHLWDSRTLRTWSVKMNFSVGRRLCEVRFAAGKHSKALSLLEDICYNLRDVLGPLDPITIECDRSRARLNGRCGNHGAALDIHMHVLKHITNPVNYHQLSQNDMAVLGGEELRLLNGAFNKGGGWCSRDGQIFIDLSRSLVDIVGGFEGNKEDLANISNWKVEPQVPPQEDVELSDWWSSFGIDIDNDTDETVV